MTDITGLDDEIDRDEVVLVSSNLQEFSIERKFTINSKLIQTMLETDKTETRLTLHNVDGETLAKVIEYLEYHYEHPAQEIEKPLRHANMRDNVVDKFDYDFVQVEHTMLFKLIMAANYLDIPSLLELCSATVACSIKGKKTEEIRKLYGIVNDFTPEEEKSVMDEVAWAEES